MPPLHTEGHTHQFVRAYNDREPDLTVTAATQLPAFSPVVVIGAGPTGLAAAALLATMGVEVCVLERNASPLILPRAIVLDDEGARTLQAAGAAEDFLPLAVEGEGPLFYDDDNAVFAEVGAGAREFGFSKRYFIHQPELEQFLLQRISRCANADVHFSAELQALHDDGEHISLKVNLRGVTHPMKASVVLACDGARSTVRDLLGIQMQGSTYDDNWLVIDTLNDPDTMPNSKAFCHVQRPYMSIPAPRGGRRYEFKMLPGESREAMTLPASIRKLMAPIRQLNDSDIARIAVYTFQARIAEQLTRGRVLLMGDAAHLTPPFAGQGMNAGLRDAMNVAWKVAMVVRGQATSSLLASYEVERRQPIAAMIQLAVTMGEIIMPVNSEDRALRGALFAKLNHFPGGRDFLVGMKFKPRPRYDDGVFVGLQRPEVPASLVGSMIPQPRVRTPHGIQRLDDVIGPRFALLVQNLATEQFAASHLATLWPELSPTLLSLTSKTEHKPPLVLRGELLDSDIALPLLAHRDQILLVRPDRYAAVAFYPEQMQAVVTAFRAQLSGTTL
jgi:3-(3-hydroxy-phenyl)propionate hydroxylase